jgi:hypothetical protein
VRDAPGTAQTATTDPSGWSWIHGILRRYPRWWVPLGKAVFFVQRDDGDAR